jgi:hypothetical protein
LIDRDAQRQTGSNSMARRRCQDHLALQRQELQGCAGSRSDTYHIRDAPIMVDKNYKIGDFAYT